MTNAWRLVIHGPGDAAWNMAVDRAMLEAHERGEVPPTLRLYRWNRPTVSIGRFQRLETVDTVYCTEAGIALTRRPTGGRGVLHDDEVTYSIVAGIRDGLPHGVKASYHLLCRLLLAAYAELGVSAELTARARGTTATGACYLQTTSADLSLGLAKLSGSAQVWHRDSCLQHGSFVISRDLSRESAVFMLDDDERQALADKTTTLTDILVESPGQEALVRALVVGLERGLTEVFGACLSPGALLPGEEATAARLCSGYRL